MYDGWLKTYTDKLTGDPTVLYEAMRYAVNAGGKRLRMAVLAECARMFGAPEAEAVPFACAVELIHTYSLTHDDLPAMDDARLRRGKPSCHAAYGECAAILAGDGLLHYAFEIMADAVNGGDAVSMQRRAGAMNEIARYAGVGHMVLGQAMDTMPAAALDMDMLKTIYIKKTASMFIGPMKSGCRLADASEQQTADISQFALDFGVAFQITDDILDETGTFIETGKEAGNDKANGKTTLSSLLGLDAARELCRSHTDAAKAAIAPHDKNGFFTALCGYALDRRR